MLKATSPYLSIVPQSSVSERDQANAARASSMQSRTSSRPSTAGCARRRAGANAVCEVLQLAAERFIVARSDERFANAAACVTGGQVGAVGTIGLAGTVGLPDLDLRRGERNVGTRKFHLHHLRARVDTEDLVELLEVRHEGVLDDPGHTLIVFEQRVEDVRVARLHRGDDALRCTEHPRKIARSCVERPVNHP